MDETAHERVPGHAHIPKLRNECGERIIKTKGAAGWQSTDKHPPLPDEEYIKKVINILAEAEIPCCVAGEHALNHYGAKLLLTDWHICVPDAELDRAGELFRCRREEFLLIEPRASSMTFSDCMDALYSRFQFTGLKLAFVLMSGKAYHLDCKAENITFTKNSIAFPKLEVLAQSLLDVYQGSELEDLIDGAILSQEWGVENLDLSGCADEEWWHWRHEALTSRRGGATSMTEPDLKLLRSSKKRYWLQISSEDGKRRRLGLKYPPDLYITRFHKRKRGDPLRRKDDHVPENSGICPRDGDKTPI